MAYDLVGKLNTFITNAKHILNVSYKPSNDEFSRSAKIIVLGILFVGLLGFIVSLLIQFFTGSTI